MDRIFYLYPFQEEQYSERMAACAERLRSYKKDGLFTGRDVRLIHYIAYEHPNASASMIICHGAGESALKYLEFASFFFDLGYQVYLFDFRGHGSSWRPVANRSVTHVNSFDEYAADLDDCIRRLTDPTLPLSIFACGMGGAAALRYLQLNPDRVWKAFLSAPTVACKLSQPEGINRLKLHRAVKKGLGRELCPGGECYRAQEVFSGSNYQSFARFAWYRERRAADTRLQNSAVTLGWLDALLINSDKLFSKGKNRKIKTKILICEAGNDQVLPPEALKLLRTRLPSDKKGTGLVCLTEALHEIQNSEQKTLNDLMVLLYEFFGKV